MSKSKKSTKLGTVSIAKTGEKKYPLLSLFLSFVFEGSKKKTAEIEGDYTAAYPVVIRDKDYLVTDYSGNYENYPENTQNEFEIELYDIEKYLTNTLSSPDDGDIFSGCDVSGFPHCCGLHVVGDLPTSGKGLDDFIVALKFFLATNKGTSHRPLMFTHSVKTELYKRIQGIPGITIVYTWKNSNTGNTLFLAMACPNNLLKDGKSSKTKKAGKARATVLS